MSIRGVTLSHLLYVIILAAIGNTAIYLGLAFINGQLLPNVVGAMYALSGYLTRTVVMVVIFAVPADFIFAFCFRIAPAGTAAMAILGTLVLVMLGNTVILEGTLNSRAAFAACVTLAAVLWFAYEQAQCCGGP